MASQESQLAERLEPVPDRIESSQAKLVYLCLEATGGATIEDLEETLTMKKIDILSVLNSLSSDGLVEQDGDRYVVTA